MITQDERWIQKYNEVKEFVETNHRNPSKHRIEEHDMSKLIIEIHPSIGLSVPGGQVSGIKNQYSFKYSFFNSNIDI